MSSLAKSGEEEEVALRDQDNGEGGRYIEEGVRQDTGDTTEGMSEIELGGHAGGDAKPQATKASCACDPSTTSLTPGTSFRPHGQHREPVGFADGRAWPLARLPCRGKPKKMRKGEPILVDFGINYHGYHMDLPGCTPSAGCRSGMSAPTRCAGRSSTRCSTGPCGGRARRLFTRTPWSLPNKAGLGPYYLGYNGHKTRFLGHGIGVELSELPYLAPRHDYPMEGGMTFAIEPKMVFPRGGASGIEDTVLLEKNGYRILSDVDDQIVIV